MTVSGVSRRDVIRGTVGMVLGTSMVSEPLAASAAEPPPAVVIVSAKLEMKSITAAELRRCFLGLEVRVGGKALIPFNHPATHALRHRFDRKILGMTPMASQRHWINTLIRGGPRPPRTVQSSDLLAKVVAKLPRGVAYVAPEVARRVEGLSMVAIDGIGPSDEHYRLR